MENVDILGFLCRRFVEVKKSYITLLSILLVVILIVGGVFFLKGKDNSQSKEDNVEGVSNENKDKTITRENGDYIYTPTNEEVGYDSEEEIFFYENMLNVYLDSEISDDQAEELAEEIEGEVVGKVGGAINMLQLEVEKNSLQELGQLTETLEDNELVEFAETSTPSFISDLNDNNDSEEKEKNDSDWWTEAINAPDAWEYIDDDKSDLKKVKLAVLETGRLGEGNEEIDAESLNTGDVTVCNKGGKAFKYEECGEEKTSKHASRVTKFIVADEGKSAGNSRGVAKGVADVKFQSIGNGYEKFIEGEKIDGVPEPFIFSLIENEIKTGAKVINNSWGFPPMTKENWDKTGEFSCGDGLTYKGYLRSTKISRDRVSAQLIVALDRLLTEESDDSSKSKNNDFLIIQGAGNGKSLFKPECDDDDQEDEWSAETATEAKNSGFFTNINDDTYNQASDLKQRGLENSLEEILNHIIIVGGAEQIGDNDDYQSPEWASYGDAIDIAAPAANVSIEEDKINGTSYATPMVSGAAAVTWYYHPDLKAAEVKNLLRETAEKEVKDNEKIEDKNYEKQSYPMLDMTAFLKETENIMEENYVELEDILLEGNLNDMYDEHHNQEEGDEIWKEGVDPDDPFYREVYDLLYPKVEDLVAEEGMESLINEKFSLFWQPPAPVSFYGPSYDIEVLDKDSESFQVEQTKEIGPQDVGGESEDLVYIIDYVKEDDKWKFAGAEKQE